VRPDVRIAASGRMHGVDADALPAVLGAPALVIMRTAPFDALSDMDVALADDAEIDDRLITEPRPRFFIAAMPCFMPRKTRWR